ncbi:MAG: MFS transporter [Spirochaetae bacterium HGW-Spirochaetae-5]|nr:MAG: MFS transporter [Spirochaetae bacterium HGW-Spirochaetae-5]
MAEQQFKISKTFLLGFGFLGISMIWSLYNAYVPVFLKDTFNLPLTAVGGIMTIDNIFAIILLPFLGALSDRTNTPIGRRRPYILVGAPLAMFFFIMIPYMNQMQSLLLMMLVIILMNLSMSLYRSPVIALMPDITPSKYRSQANGIINLMGGVGALLAFFGSKPLYNMDKTYPFIAGGMVMLFACMMVVLFINEDKSLSLDNGNTDKVSFKKSFDELMDNLKDVIHGDKSLLFILLSILFWFIGFNSIETFFTLYAKYYLGIGETSGATILGYYSLIFMLTAIPSGIIGARIGRRKTIRIGLTVLMVCLLASLAGSFFISKDKTVLIYWSYAAAFMCAGFGWALVNVNSLPMVVDMTTAEKVGGYTGLYYFFSQAANIAAPPVAGFVLDLSTDGGKNSGGYISLLLFAVALFFIAFITMSKVRRGEAQDA